LVFHPDGTSATHSYLLDKAPPPTMKINGTAPVSSKTFDNVPKRLRFFLEKASSSAGPKEYETDEKK